MLSQLTSFDIVATWQLLPYARDMESMMKMYFTALEIVRHRMKFDSRYVALIINIHPASHP